MKLNSLETQRSKRKIVKPAELSPETMKLLKQRAEAFCRKLLDKLVLINNDGKEIVVDPMIYSGDLWMFDTIPLAIHFATKVDNDIQTIDTSLNFVKIKVKLRPRPEVEIEYVHLDDPRLLHRGVYPALIKLIADNFPEGFVLTSQLEEPHTHSSIINAMREGDLTTPGGLEKIKDEIKKSYLIRISIAAGFNKISLTFETGPSEEDHKKMVTIIQEVAEIIPNQTEPVIILPKYEYE